MQRDRRAFFVNRCSKTLRQLTAKALPLSFFVGSIQRGVGRDSQEPYAWIVSGENFNIFDFRLTDAEMTAISALDEKKSPIYDDMDLATVRAIRHLQDS